LSFLKITQRQGQVVNQGIESQRRGKRDREIGKQQHNRRERNASTFSENLFSRSKALPGLPNLPPEFDPSPARARPAKRKASKPKIQTLTPMKTPIAKTSREKMPSPIARFKKGREGLFPSPPGRGPG
jgi:hypothetical protein